MKRSVAVLLLMVLAFSVLGGASASTTASRRYEASGDPVLLCPLNDMRASAKGACLPVPSDVNQANIIVRDDGPGVYASFTVDFVNAAGVPMDPVGAASTTAFGALGWSGGYPFCWNGSAGIPQGAAYMRVNFVSPSPFSGCGMATSGLVDVQFTNSSPFPW